MYEVVDATQEHLAQLSKLPLRQADVDEWFISSGGHNVRKLITEAPLSSDSSVTRALIREDGICVALWGGRLDDHGNTMIWLIASQCAEKRAKEVAALWDHEVAILKNLGGILYAITWDGNRMHQAWLRRVGFKVWHRMSEQGHSFSTYVKVK